MRCLATPLQGLNTKFEFGVVHFRQQPVKGSKLHQLLPFLPNLPGLGWSIYKVSHTWS